LQSQAFTLSHECFDLHLLIGRIVDNWFYCTKYQEARIGLTISDDYHKGSYWIGAERISDRFEWLNHTPLNATEADWDSDQPDNTETHNRVCVSMHKHSRLQSYTWHDHECTEKSYNYICEKVWIDWSNDIVIPIIYGVFINISTRTGSQYYLLDAHISLIIKENWNFLSFLKHHFK
jgi:hypothetical protein